MESLAVFLEPYKDLISSSAAAVTHFHQLSGAVVCYSIYKQKSTEDRSLLPFLAGTVISTMVLRFGMILNDTPTIQVSLIGTLLNIVYICFYNYYTNNVKDKSLARTQMGYAGAFLAALFSYTFVENPKVLPFRYGMTLTVVLFFFVGLPLLKLRKIIRKKSTAGLPFPMILTGTLISFLWFLYGVVSRERFVILQNGTIFLLSALQLSLFAIYPSKPSKSTEATKSPSTNSNKNKKKD